MAACLEIRSNQVPIVAVTGTNMERYSDIPKYSQGHIVFFLGSVVNDVTRMNDDVGGGILIINVVDHASEIFKSVFQFVGFRIDMAIGYLGYYHCIQTILAVVRH